MPSYHLHAPRVSTDLEKARAVRIPMFTRSGREVLALRSFNRETMRVVCLIEGCVEHTYDYDDLLHHLGDPGKRAHFEAAGFPVKNAHAHRIFAPLLDAMSGGPKLCDCAPGVCAYPLGERHEDRSCKAVRPAG
jgi:hypothetical protein